jgi:hypothetical protein
MKKSLSQNEIATVRTLADLLTEAAPLVDQLNSPQSSDESRALLRTLVGPVEFIELAVSFNLMASARLWEMAHADEPLGVEMVERLRRLGVK